MWKTLLISIIGFIAGIAGNLIAGWIQGDIWKNKFKPVNLLITILLALLAILISTYFQEILPSEIKTNPLLVTGNKSPSISNDGNGIIVVAENPHLIITGGAKDQPAPTPTLLDYHSFQKLGFSSIELRWNPQPGATNHKYGYVSLNVCSTTSYFWMIPKQVSPPKHDLIKGALYEPKGNEPCIYELKPVMNLGPNEITQIWLGNVANKTITEIEVAIFEISFDADMNDIKIKELPSEKLQIHFN